MNLYLYCGPWPASAAVLNTPDSSWLESLTQWIQVTFNVYATFQSFFFLFYLFKWMYFNININVDKTNSEFLCDTDSK